MARPEGFEPSTPGLEGPSSKTGEKWPAFANLETPIAYDIAVIIGPPANEPTGRVLGQNSCVIGESESTAITDRPPVIEFGPDFAPFRGRVVRVRGSVVLYIFERPVGNG